MMNFIPFLKLLHLVGVITAQNQILPTIFWHPRYPIFACDNPVLNVRYEDQINFSCPTEDINPSSKLASSGPEREELYESMSLVRTEQEFRTCNATGGIRFLRCDKTRSSELCGNGGIDCPSFYNMFFKEAGSPNDITFEKGGDYYLIATSYRTPDRLDGKIGGSCNNRRTGNEYFMRLKIHVCTDREVDDGKCERCLTEACYYKGCKIETQQWQVTKGLIHQNQNKECFVPEKRNIIDQLIGVTNTEFRDKSIVCPADKCTQWITNEREQYFKNNKCFREQVRNCTSMINNSTKTERSYKEVLCPRKVCSQWKDEREKIYKNLDLCFVPQTRSCLHPWVQVTVTEYNETEVSCSDAFNGPMTGGVKSAEETDDKKTIYIVIAVFSSVLCFTIGTFIGSYIVKRLHKKKKQLNQNSQIATIPAAILDGETYLNTKPEGVDLVNDAPFYLVDGMMLGANGIPPSVHEEPVQPNGKQPVTRSVSFNHFENRSVTPQPTSTLPRNQGRNKVARVPSATSQILLLRHVSDAASFHGSRLNSENLERFVSQNKLRLNSTTEENVYDV